MSEPDLSHVSNGGIVGRRQLIAVQTIDLGRLTHHPVPLVPSAFVAVSGTGPDRDSNGSGKTTFLAALSLLLGDPEWRVATTGGNDALGLLFDPDLSGDAAGLYDPARVGYVAGVFAHVTADGHYDDLTVWVRISSDESPRVAARWAPGEHLVADREEATAQWNALGRERQIGPQSFVEQLYGGTGRCLAYVTSRGNRDTDTSLMQLQARLSPTRIGSELIVLLGLEHLVDAERDLRSKLAAAQQLLATRIEEHARQEGEWESTLADIEARESARAALSEGKRVWQLRIARRLLDAITAAQRLTETVTELDTELDGARLQADDVEARIAELPDLAELVRRVTAVQSASEVATRDHTTAHTETIGLDRDLADVAGKLRELTTRALAAPAGLTLPEAEARAREAANALEASTRGLGAAEADADRARGLQDAVTAHGDVDPRAREALRAAGLEFQPLLDGIVLDEAARKRWEPLLAPWRGALVVADAQRESAVTAVPPGTVLVIADETRGPSPAGVVEAPRGTGRFLAALAARAQAPYADVHAGVVVAGGFEHELCGRDAAIARARADLERAARAVEVAGAERDRMQRAHELAVDAVARLRAAEQVTRLRADESELEGRLAMARQALAEAETRRDDAQRALVDAQVAHGTADRDRGALEQERDAAAHRRGECERAIAEARTAIERLDLDGWRAAWGDTDDSAGAALDGDDRQEDSLRRRANEQLGIALERIGVDSSSGVGAPDGSSIGEVVRARSGLDDEVLPTHVVRRFDTVAQPLVDWLDDQLERDTTFRDEVETERDRWNELIGAARRECETQGDLLERHRDMVEQQIEAALGHVSARYSELDAAAAGYGARLHWRSLRPDAPTDLWVWEVTPEWRRAPGAKWLAYTRQANSAMQKQHRTHLVLAALLAAQDPAGRVLIVDEAGNDFGREHLRQVLSAFAHVAETHGVTVIAACQDKVLEELAALGAARLLMWFERLSDSSPLCRPTRVWGFDSDGARVEVTRSAVEAGRLL